MARTKTVDGKRVGMSAKFSEPEAAEIDAAVNSIKNNPLEYQYSDLQGVLQDYLSGLSAPKPAVGQLAFTGAELLLILGAGAGLIGSGIALRRRRA